MENLSDFEAGTVERRWVIYLIYVFQYKSSMSTTNTHEAKAIL
jgi:hypothetical protein